MSIHDRIVLKYASPEEAEKIQRAFDTRDQILRLRKQKQELKEHYDSLIAQVESEIRDIQKHCTHDLVNYHQDTYDSYTECAICGASWKGIR